MHKQTPGSRENFKNGTASSVAKIELTNLEILCRFLVYSSRHFLAHNHVITIIIIIIIIIRKENIIQISKPLIERRPTFVNFPLSGFDKILMLEQYTAVKSGEQGTYAQKFNAKCVEVKLQF